MTTRFEGDSDYTHGCAEGSGVLITNLGSPDAPDSAAVRRYLAEFLWDPRVVEMSRPLWWLILHGIVLRVRPRRSAHAYQKIWTGDGSPLSHITRRQAEALSARLAERVKGPFHLAWAMRYGSPSIRDGLEELRAAGARRIVVMPLYPQYSGATTASTFDAVADVLRRWRWIPELRFVTHYHDDPAYIAALAASLREHWGLCGEPQKLLFSFHGMPRRTVLAGDPYFCQCQKTARLVAEQLGLPGERWQVTFQSRFGREEWLQPYTDKTLKKLGREGVSHVDVVCPGFAADCLETLEEIAIQNKDVFLEAGGGRFHYVPALNDRPDHVSALADIILRQLRGWPGTAEERDVAAAQAAATRERARALGAAR